MVVTGLRAACLEGKQAMDVTRIWLLQSSCEELNRSARTHTAEIWEAEDIWPGKGFNLQLKNSDVWSGLSCLPLYGSQERLSAWHLVFSLHVHKQLSYVLLNSLSGHFCAILTVILFYIAGFPRKQTGENIFTVSYLIQRRCDIRYRWYACLWSSVYGLHTGRFY